MTDTALATVAPTSGAALAEQVAIKGDLSKLTEQQRMDYYSATCSSLGLNPLTRPFDYLSLNGKLVLYANRSCADQLRTIRGITITSLDPRQIGDLLVCVATGRDRDGREDSSTGVVNVKGLGGEALANAMMKAETKAKRRLTLSLAGLGWSDESEVDSIPGAARTDVDSNGVIKPTPSLAERAAAKAAEVKAPAPVATTDSGAPVDADGVIEGEWADAAPTPTMEEIVEAGDTAGIDAKALARRLLPEWVAANPKRLPTDAERVSLMAAIKRGEH